MQKNKKNSPKRDLAIEKLKYMEFNVKIDIKITKGKINLNIKLYKRSLDYTRDG